MRSLITGTERGVYQYLRIFDSIRFIFITGLKVHKGLPSPVENEQDTLENTTI